MGLLTTGIDDSIFWVVRNPTDPKMALVSWDVMDTRTKAIVATFATQPLAQDDAEVRNDAL